MLGNCKIDAHHSRCVPIGGSAPFVIIWPRKSSPPKHIKTITGQRLTRFKNLKIQENPSVTPIKVHMKKVMFAEVKPAILPISAAGI